MMKHVAITGLWVLPALIAAKGLHVADPFGLVPYITCPIMTKAEWAEFHAADQTAWVCYGLIAAGLTGALWSLMPLRRIPINIKTPAGYAVLYGTCLLSGFVIVVVLQFMHEWFR